VSISLPDFIGQDFMGQDFMGTGSWREVLPLGIAGVVVWSLWLYRAVTSRFAHPVVNDFRTTTSVVVPSYREDANILIDCLSTWLAQDPTEVIVVVDIEDLECRERLEDVKDNRLRVIVFRHEGKRSALGRGIREATGEIVVLSDSDTM
jgi:N-acetylglucosaminyltransferase